MTEVNLTRDHLHAHLEARMRQRGVTLDEIAETLAQGWPAADARPGTESRTFVFAFDSDWLGRRFREKEVTVYYKRRDEGEIVLLTVKARYGQAFPRR